MTIQEHIQKHILSRLDAAKSLVVYDPDRRYEALVCAMQDKSLTIINGSTSTILGRDQAMDIWCRLSTTASDDTRRMMVYLPVAKPKSEEERQQNPYEIFSLGGGVFPDGDDESYAALCRKFAPEQAGKIDKLFAAGTPDFETINHLMSGGTNWPRLKSLLKVESAMEIVQAVLIPTDRQALALKADDSWVPEFREFVKAVLGASLTTRSTKHAAIADDLWRLILFSEFIYDLPGELPSSLKDISCASDTAESLVYGVCDAIRSREGCHFPYMEAANRVAEELQLQKHMSGITALGDRDTFAFEEQVYLTVFTDEVIAGRYDQADDVYTMRTRSIWVKHIGDRQLLWTVAERALGLIITAGEMEDRFSAMKADTDALFAFYCESYHTMDRRHRDFEQAVTNTYGELDCLDKLVVAARRAYFQASEKLQSIFMSTVRQQGWPVSGRVRSVDVFEKYVSPLITERRKVAFFMVDALRYELALQLDNELSASGKVKVDAVCGQLPSITQVGMAALMPQEEGGLRIAVEARKPVPYIGDRKVLVPADRLACLKPLFGDRCAMIDLDEIVSAKMNIPETVQLLVVKTTDIDQLAESQPMEARRMMPELIRKLIAGVKRIGKAGFDHAVIVTDHGFLLFDDSSAGDTLAKPMGDWSVEKDRFLLGKGSSSTGVMAFDKADVGIDGDFEHYAVPQSFGTFAKGNPYFHGGLSLQECILPVMTVDFGTRKQSASSDKPELKMSYKGGTTNKTTTRRPMIEISMHSEGLPGFDTDVLEFRLDAYHKKELVGEAASCSFVNSASGMVKIANGQAIKVPLKMDEDFQGSFEVRACDPDNGLNHAVLKLKTDYMD